MKDGADGYADPELAYWLWRALRGRGRAAGEALGEWLSEQGAQTVLSTFCGPAATELHMVSRLPHDASAVLTDGSEPLLAHARSEATATGLEARVRDLVAAGAPWDAPSFQRLRSHGPYDCVTCLGVSIIHLPTADARKQFLNCCFELTRPGGWLIIDNKRWTADLREDGRVRPLEGEAWRRQVHS